MIGCCLDLHRGEATFYRNGRSMGVAFARVRSLQPHLAYFPAVSLSHAERAELNFGATPLTYPVPGYQPVQVRRGCHGRRRPLTVRRVLVCLMCLECLA